MARPFQKLATVVLHENASYSHPPSPPVILHSDDPALSAMTDLNNVTAVTVSPDTSIDLALVEMKACGIHILLVVDDKEVVKGIVSSEDILGHQPLTITQMTMTKREEITVSMVMTPSEQIVTFDIHELRFAKIGDLVKTMNHYHQHCALVVEFKDNIQVVRGLFSLHFISKALGENIFKEIDAANTLLAMKKEIESE